MLTLSWKDLAQIFRDGRWVILQTTTPSEWGASFLSCPNIDGNTAQRCAKGLDCSRGV
jgi:hypothetical protein